RKKAGFRYVMDVIPLDATLIKGSHGSINTPAQFHPLLITDQKENNSTTVAATGVYDVIWRHLKSNQL
ncbi:MAG TPA: hypothetical protein VKA92_07530, partial [Segetibacter sp.]|nr:hypothetical protein [Segetibacter sp.]